jgi:hypothetical protein
MWWRSPCGCAAMSTVIVSAVRSKASMIPKDRAAWLCLERLFAGLNAIGLDRETALRMIEDIALASVPPIRRRAFELLGETPATTREIAQVLKLPTNTARRVLEDLAAQGLAVRERSKGNDGEEKKTGADRWSVDPDWTDWRVKWQATVSA